jgi:hypothetical protein
MLNRSTLRPLVYLLPFLWGGCNGDCPRQDVEYLPIESGTYRGVSSEAVKGRRAVIDRQAGTARFTFERNGKQVVEVWRITARTIR